MKKQWKWLLPLLILGGFLPFSPKLDLALSHHFYQDGAWTHHPLWDFMYLYGKHVVFAVFFISMCVWIASFFWRPFKHFRRDAAIITLTIAIGAGLIVNILCKGFLGRPRPKQIVEHGGTFDYRPAWNPNLDPQRIHQKSLPSGHVAIGFSYSGCLFSRHRSIRYAGWIFTAFWGPGLMIARMAQGGHFLSDVLIAPCIMWWTVLSIISIYHLLDDRKQRHIQSKNTPN